MHKTKRTRRLRKTENIRRLVRETRLSVDDFVYPIFVQDGENIEHDITSMPGIKRFSIDRLAQELGEIVRLNIPAVLLFGVPGTKDETGTKSWHDDGIVQKAVRYIKQRHPSLYVITDVCFCEYTSHGHCGVIEGIGNNKEGDVDNDATLLNIQKQALSHVQAGADMVAPSGMMDGSVAAVRAALDEHKYTDIPIMAYSIKYASAFYGPFRDAAEAAPTFGDRRTYQMDPANRREGLLRASYDEWENADILMVKPTLAYLDVVAALKSETNKPVACYNVSGEYAMIKAAAANGWLDEEQAMLESLLSMKRAGADIIITYFAKQAAAVLQRKI